MRMLAKVKDEWISMGFVREIFFPEGAEDMFGRLLEGRFFLGKDFGQGLDADNEYLKVVE